MRRLALTVLIVSLCITPSYASELNDRAQVFWSRYNVHPCSPLTVAYTQIPGGLGYATPGNCSILLDRSLLVMSRTDLCRVFIHEAGHTAGLQHVNNGWVMDSRGLPYMPVIGTCNEYAR